MEFLETLNQKEIFLKTTLVSAYGTPKMERPDEVLAHRAGSNNQPHIGGAGMTAVKEQYCDSVAKCNDENSGRLDGLGILAAQPTGGAPE